MKENEFKKLPKGNYKAVIKSKFKKGHLELSHALIKGSSKKKFSLVAMFVIPLWQIMN